MFRSTAASRREPTGELGAAALDRAASEARAAADDQPTWQLLRDDFIQFQKMTRRAIQTHGLNTDQLGTRVGDLPLATPPSPLPASEPQECSAFQVVAEQQLRPALALSLHPSTPLPSTAPRHRSLLSVFVYEETPAG